MKDDKTPGRPDGSSSQATAIPSRGPADAAASAEKLALLSAAATQGRLWAAPEVEYRSELTDERWYISQGRGNLSGCEVSKNDALFWVALVNAYRSGFLVPASQWKPIETAPKDGTQVLAWSEKDNSFFGRFVVTRWVDDYGTVCGPTYWMPEPEPPASCDEHPQGEDPQGAESRSDASGVGLQAETPGFAACRQAAQRASEQMAWAKPEATPSIPPSPRKGQEESPCTMTVEEAREVVKLFGTLGTADSLVGLFRSVADHWSGATRTGYLAHADRLELALSTIRASEEDR